jgi:hypothetical protein
MSYGPARSTAAAVRRVIGRDPEFICPPGTYDQKHIDRVGKLQDCIAYIREFSISRISRMSTS